MRCVAADPQTAADVVADTFLVAWQRIDAIPADHERGWLFGVARNVIAHHHRISRRAVDLAARLRQELARMPPIQSEVSEDLASAFRTIPDADQELLRLVAWEA